MSAGAERGAKAMSTSAERGASADPGAKATSPSAERGASAEPGAKATSPSAERRRAHLAMLELLEKRHGVGSRASVVSSWMQARLDHALDGLLSDTGGRMEEALELLRTDGSRLEEIAERLRVGETRFFRDPAQWASLRQTLGRFAHRERVRALSVGCSTGEEAWSLAMILDETCGPRRQSYRVVGMDRSEAAIEAARGGTYDADCRDQVPDDLAAKYLEGSDGELSVHAALRSSVSFVARDAMLGPPPGHYEVILCKNLLIYFGSEAAARAVELLLRALGDGGFLMVARSEVPRVKALGHRTEELGGGIVVFR